MAKTVLILAWFWLSAAAASPVALSYLLLEAFGLGRLAMPALRWTVRTWALVVLRIIGVRLSVSGLEKVPASGRLCFVGNHQGDLDIVIMEAVLPSPAGFIAKSQVAWFPFLNLWALALGSAFIVRNSPHRGRKAIVRGVESIKRGKAIVIYPEGTRSRGRAMLPFKRGSLKLATMAEAAIVPVTIDGSFRVWEEHRRIRAAKVTVQFHDPIPTAGLDPEARKELPDRVRAAIAAGLAARSVNTTTSL